MNGKSVLYLLAFLVSISVVVNAVPKYYVNHFAANNNNTNLSNNLIVGARLPGDRLVLRQNIVRGSSWNQAVTYQQTFNASKSYERITQVRALDQMTNGYGATASLVKGGPGLNSVTLRFKSQKSQRINFVVELYARA